MIPEGLPEHSLGWGILQWCSRMLAHPDGNDNYEAGSPWVFSDEQALFIVWFYAIDEYGKFIYRKAVLERPKGWGKSPLLAAISCAEFLGPTNFAGWSKSGHPLGKLQSSPTVQIAAISDSQAENTYALCREMLLQGRISTLVPGLEVMMAKSTAPGGRKLEKVTASPRGREGNRPTFILMDETHLWVPAEQGPQLYEALYRNLSKKNRRFIATTNAHAPGEESVAESMWDAYQKQLDGTAFDESLLFDSREVFVENIYDPEAAIPALKYVYGDSVDPQTGWVDLGRIWADINDPTTKEHVARRFFFNMHTQGHSSWLNQAKWRAREEKTLKLKKTDVIALGLKGNLKGATCLVACRLRDGALFNFSDPAWERPDIAPPDWMVNERSVDGRLRKILEKYEVCKVLVSPQEWQDWLSRWDADYPDIFEEFWINNKTKMAKAVEQFETAVEAGRLAWIDPQLNRHVMACHTEETPQGHIIRKETKASTRYISGAQAAVLAFEASSLAIEEGALSKPSNELVGI